VHFAAEQARQSGAIAAVGHMGHANAGHHLELLAREVADAAGPGRTHVDLARIGFRVGDELRHRFRRYRWVDRHHQRRSADPGDWHNVAQEIEAEIVVECGIGRVVRAGQKQRVAIRPRVDDGVGGKISRGARPVLDHEGLAEAFRQPLSHQAGDEIVAAAGSESDDPTDGPRRIGLRRHRSRENRERRRARCEAQKSAAGKLRHWPVSYGPTEGFAARPAMAWSILRCPSSGRAISVHPARLPTPAMNSCRRTLDLLPGFWRPYRDLQSRGTSTTGRGQPTALTLSAEMADISSRSARRPTVRVKG
jgi:hypothetical protein